MKTITRLRAAVLAVAILSVSASCQSLEAPVPAAVDCEPVYQPPVMVPGTNCRNFCVYVYEGVIDLAAGTWSVNCETLGLRNARLRVLLDDRHVSTLEGEYLPTLRIQFFRPGVSIYDLKGATFCRRDAFVRSEDQEGRLQFVSYPQGDGVLEEMMAVFEKPVQRVRYRILTTLPLPLETVLAGEE